MEPELDPVTRGLESLDPEAELPMAATNALQAIRSLPMQS